MKTPSSPNAHSNSRVEIFHVCDVRVPSITNCRSPSIEADRAATCIGNTDNCNVREVSFGHTQSREGFGIVFGPSPDNENWSTGVNSPIEGSCSLFLDTLSISGIECSPYLEFATLPTLNSLQEEMTNKEVIMEDI